MPPNPRVAKAFRAMKDLGIKEEKVKPVLKRLLKLYDKNWELIEEENYRALADAIFENEETEATEKKRSANSEREDLEEAQLQEEPERPLKRLRLRHKDAQASPSFCNVNPNLVETTLKRPKLEEAELPEGHSHHQSIEVVDSKRSNVESTRVESECALSQSFIRNKGKQPISPRPMTVQEGSHSSQPEYSAVSSPTRVRDKGKEPVSPQIAARENRPFSKNPTHAVLLKQSHVENSIVLSCKQKLHDVRALIKPKDEPVTDDLPQFEVPIAVIHPNSLPNGDSSIGHSSVRERQVFETLASQSINGEDKRVTAPPSSSLTKTNCELANIPDESTSNLDIASSPFGEVKISFNFNSAVGRPDFHMPSLDAVLKMVEDRCLREYKLLDPNFSVMKLMKDMCDCVLELGTDTANESQETIDVTPAIGLLKKTFPADGFGASNPLNGSVNIPCGTEVVLPQTPRLPHSRNGSDVNIGGNTCEENGENVVELTNSRSLVVVQQHELTPDNIRSLHDVNDLAKGQEGVVISLANDVNSACPPSFYYIPQNVVFQNANVNFTLACIGDDNCCSICVENCLLSSRHCACAHETGGEFAYTLEGVVKEEFLEECISVNHDPLKHRLHYCKECPLERFRYEESLKSCKGHLVRKFIKECWYKCGCSKQCGNRVVQRGMNCKLQVFMTHEGKGWGLRTLEDLPKGAFICEYAGEVLTSVEMYDRISRIPSLGEHSYSVPLDAYWGSDGVLKDEEALCLDATYYGNIARFINHRCGDSNLVEIPVEVETPDHHYYHLAFFTTRKVEAMEELTWDYGIDFDGGRHPLKAFHCRCGSKFCRNIKRSSSIRRGVVLASHTMIGMYC